MNKNDHYHIEILMREFLTKLKKEYSIYEKMVFVCKEERGFIERGEVEELQLSLSNKHVLLDEIVHIEEDIKLLKEKWSKHKETIREPLKSEIELFIKTFKELMEMLMKYQEENEVIMCRQNELKTTELSVVRKRKRLTRAYSVYGNNSPRSRYMNKVL